MKPFGALLAFVCIWSTNAMAVQQVLRQIPDEYESSSGFGTAMNNAGYAANDSISAIRANPALISQQKQYTVAGGYHWPVAGREYYQAEVVDSRSGNVAAGISYTGFTEDYAYASDNDKASPIDSPIVRRGVLALAQNVGPVFAGVGATYVEGHQLFSTKAPWEDEERVKGFGLNAGLVYPFGNGWSAGAAIENASNRKIKDYAPKTVKGGVAGPLGSGVSAMLDVRQRDRVAEFEGDVLDLNQPPGDTKELKPETMGFASFTADLQQYFRLIGSYGRALSGSDRRSVAGGASLLSQNFSLSYTLSRPYMSESTTHQAITVSLDVAL